jgi:predicted DNA-binding protein
MALVSIRLPEKVESRLAEEAERAQRPKSEIAREAIVDYLDRIERDRFLGEIARAARSGTREEAVGVAEESLALDNEAVSITEQSGVQEARPQYRKRKKKRS